ncbi:phospholipase A [Algicola sagamiensis]|uniref:phospholipase A n=1 Tax=Algicola sagamiensis TaxID=163869 RepID=UPI0003999787|nr:phospholipase A [Algicola sagamiensis]
MNLYRKTIFVLFLGAFQVEAANLAQYNECILEQVEKAEPNTTIETLQAWCKQFIAAGKEDLSDVERRIDELESLDESVAKSLSEDSLLGKRLRREAWTAGNRNVITPHKKNYLLPVSYVSHPNDEPQPNQTTEAVDLDNMESKFQFSIKVPVFSKLFAEDDALFFAFTSVSYWQVYNNDISSPFRETNYEPEIFWVKPVQLDWLGLDWLGLDASLLVLGINHQSNGQNVPFSRSWNRIYADVIWEKNGWVFSFKPWWRIPEKSKQHSLDPEGDDNPDIGRYMGHFELNGVYRLEGDREFSWMLRNNLRKDNRGALQIDYSFPLWGRMKGYVQYFQGYGESLIDYNESIQRVGIGVLLTESL